MGKKKRGTSQTYQIRVPNFARQQIDDTNEYNAFVNQQPLNALKVSEAIENTINRIEANPFAYKECEQLPSKSKMYRQAVCLSWLIIYKIVAEEILILSVIHSARNLGKIKALKKVK